MEFFQPEYCAGKQEIPDLVAAIVIDQGAPFEMFTAARVMVFIELGTVEPGQCMCIFWEMSRYPIQEYTDVMLMEIIDKITKIIR